MQLSLVSHQQLLALVLVGQDGQGNMEVPMQSLSARLLSTDLKQFGPLLEERKGSLGFNNSGLRTFLPDVMLG